MKLNVRVQPKVISERKHLMKPIGQELRGYIPSNGVKYVKTLPGMSTVITTTTRDRIQVLVSNDEEITKFLCFIYSDPYLLGLERVVEVVLHPCQRYTYPI
jgi:hypothetical protein